MTSSQHGLYRLGYTRITMVVTKDSNNVSWSKLIKAILVRIISLKFGNMKVESLVIVN